jgi:DNA-binding XRE family transcriptional regulator
MVESAFHKYFSEHNCEKQIIVSVDGVEDGSTEFFSIDVYPSAIKLARSFEKVFDFEIETSDSTFDAIQRQKDFSQKAEKYRKLKENNPCLILDKVAEDLFGDKNALKDELKRDELDRFLFENSQRHMPKKVVELASSPSNLISGWRKYLNISEIEAAKRLRVSEKRYQEIECLRRVPKETKVKVCKAFGISMYNLDELVSL